MYNIKVKKMIEDIRDALILEHGYNFLKLSVKDQEALIIKTYFDARTEE